MTFICCQSVTKCCKSLESQWRHLLTRNSNLLQIEINQDFLPTNVSHDGYAHSMDGTELLAMVPQTKDPEDFVDTLATRFKSVCTCTTMSTYKKLDSFCQIKTTSCICLFYCVTIKKTKGVLSITQIITLNNQLKFSCRLLFLKFKCLKASSQPRILLGIDTT